MCIYQKEVVKVSVSKVLALWVGVYVSKQLHVDDRKEHEEDASEGDDGQELRAVPHYLEEEVPDVLVGSDQPRQTSCLEGEVRA